MTGLDVPRQDPSPAGPPIDPYQDQIRRLRAGQQERESRFLADFQTALLGDPDKVAEAQKIAQQIGHPIEAVENNLDVAKAVARQRDVRYQDLAVRNPAVLRAFEDVNFLRLAADDFDNLLAVDTTWQAMGRKFDAGRAINERGVLGSKLAAGIGDASEHRKRLAEVDETIRNAGRDSGVLAQTAEVVGQMSGTVPIALGAGAAAGALASVGGPVSSGTAFAYGTGAAFFAQTATIEGGNSYLALLEQGTPPDQAASIALGLGLIKGSLETVAGKVLAAPFSRLARRLAGEAALPGPLRAAVTDYAKVLGTELGTEELQEITDIVGEAIGRPIDGREPTWAEVRQRLTEIAVKTTQGTVLLGIPGAATTFATQREKVIDAKERAAAFERAEQVVAESKLKPRSPEAFEAFAGEVTKNTTQETMHFDGATLAEVLYKTSGEGEEVVSGKLPIEDLEKLIPGIAERVREAAESGGSVTIPSSEFLAKVSGESVGELLKPHARFDPDGMSASEAEKVDVEAMAKDAESLVEKEKTKAEQFAAESEEVAAALQAQFETVPKVSKSEARRMSSLWQSLVETQSERLGITPKEFAASYPLSVEAGELTDGVAKKQEGGFNPKTWRIVLTPDATRTTFLHEMGHAMLSIYSDLAAKKAHPTIVDDFGQFLDWVGVDEAAWQGLSLEQQRKHHENFAANFESHMFDGDAATPKLQKMFDRFVDWLKRVYVSITRGREKLNQDHRRDFGEDLLPLTPEIRAVMDRMLASEQEVRIAQQVRGAVPLFQTQEESGLNDQEWIALRQKQLTQDDAAIATMTKESLGVMRWLGREKGRLAKEAKTKEAKVRQDARGDVAAQVQAQPVYRAQLWLTKGELLDATGKKQDSQGPHKLSREIVGAWLAPGVLEEDLLATELLPDESTASLASLPPAKQMAALRRYLVRDGLHPDGVAGMFGFGTGEQLVTALLDAAPIADAIEAALDAKMLAEHSELADPVKREALIDKSLHNEARARFAAAELAALEKRPSRITLAAAKLAAKRAIETKTLREATPRNFGIAARRASQRAAEEAKAGNTVEAIRWKRRQLLQELMAQEAIGLRDEVRKTRTLFAKFNQSDKNVARLRDIDLVYAGQALSAAYGLGGNRRVDGEQRRDLVARGLDVVQTQEPVLWARIEPLLRAAGGQQRELADQTVGAAREIAQVGEALWETAKDRNELNAEGKRTSLAEAVGAMTGAIGSLPPRSPTAAAATGETPKPVSRAFLKGWNLLAALKRVEQWAFFMDGQKDGPFTRYLFRPIQRAATAFRAVQVEVVREYRDAVVKLREAAGSRWDSRIYVEGLDFTFQGKKELVGALLHMGTASNFRKLLLGRRGKNGQTWGQLVDGENGEQVLDSSRFDRSIADLFQRGVLGQADIEFVQSVWARYAKFLPLAQKTHKAVFGYEFATIEHRKVRFGDVEVDGGYVPARVDRDETAPRAQIDSLEDLEQRFQHSIETPKGFTLARNPSYYGPLSLDVARQLQYVDEEVRFIHMQPAIKDAVRIIRNREFKDTLNAYDREAITGMLEPWLDTSARQSTNRSSGIRVLDTAASWARQAGSLIALGANVINAAIQVTGLSSSLTQVKGSFMRSALGNWAKNPSEAARTARDKSQFMAQRDDVLTRKLGNDVRAMVKGGWAEQVSKFQGAAGRAAFFMQRMTQGVADIVTWNAAYAQGVAEGMAEQDAIESADGAVRRSQGSQNPEDRAAYEASTPFAQLFTQFGSFSNVMLNQILSAQPGFAGKATAIGWALFLPAILEGTIRTALQGGPDDDDADGTIDDWAAVFGINIARNTAGLLPGIGPAFLSMAASEGSRVASPATVALQAIGSGVSAAIDAASGEDITDAKVKAIAALLTATTGIPISAPARLLLPAETR